MGKERRLPLGLAGGMGLFLLALSACASDHSGVSPYDAQYHPAGMPYGRVSDGTLPLRDFEIHAQEAHQAAMARLAAQGQEQEQGTAPEAAPAAESEAPDQSPAPQLATLPQRPAAAPALSKPLGPAALSNLAQLKGMSAQELQAAFGAPSLLRQDGPAQFWQYAGKGCVLHVFLYDENGSYQVAYSEVRMENSEITNPPTCIAGKPLSEASGDMAVPAAARPAALSTRVDGAKGH